MSARDVIANRIAGPSAKNWADATIAALTAVGYRILGPDEIDPVTVEKCAEVAEHAAVRTHDCGVHADNIASAIRALPTGGER